MYSVKRLQIKERMNSIECRFCDNSISVDNLEESNSIDGYNCSGCDSEKRKCFQEPMLGCGHANHYMSDYYNDSMPCLNKSCISQDAQNLDDFCGICGIEPLRRYPLVQVDCGHIFHADCISKRWNIKSNPINFKNQKCPLCSADITKGIPSFDLDKISGLKLDLKVRIPSQLRECDIEIDKQPDDSGYLDEALRKLNYYSCFKCSSVYYGGLRECGEHIEVPDDEMICGGCRGCKIHGSEHMIYKCKFCCSIATFFCFGHTHYCKPCK